MITATETSREAFYLFRGTTVGNYARRLEEGSYFGSMRDGVQITSCSGDPVYAMTAGKSRSSLAADDMILLAIDGSKYPIRAGLESGGSRLKEAEFLGHIDFDDVYPVRNVDEFITIAGEISKGTREYFDRYFKGPEMVFTNEELTCV